MYYVYVDCGRECVNVANFSDKNEYNAFVQFWENAGVKVYSRGENNIVFKNN